MSATLLKDHQFHEYCKVLKIPQNQLVPSDPDKKLIEKAFRKCALKTHPDKVHIVQCTYRPERLHLFISCANNMISI